VPHPDRPSGARLLGRALVLACPCCGRRGLIRNWVGWAPVCPNCGLVTERTEGHWSGALGLNTVLSFGALLIGLFVVLAWTWPATPPLWALAVLVAVGLTSPLVLLPFARLLWLAVDLWMRPTEAGRCR